MPSTIIVGAQWGDEGKGKVVDFYAKNADYIVRYNGGDNAGHTVVVNNDIYKLHLIPSGILYGNKWNLIGNGVVINPDTFCREIDSLEKRGCETKMLVVDKRAHIIMPYHKTLDGIQESYRKERAIETTKRGVGPAYMDKAGRSEAIRVMDLLDGELLKKKLQSILPIKELTLKSYGSSLSYESLMEICSNWGKRLKPFVGNVSRILNDALDREKRILFEGAQGTLLDIDHGTYPYVTSSNPTAGGACTGTGIGPTKIDEVIGVAKAYTTRVGGGPFPTELLGKKGEKIRIKGNEFGTTTGRPRRCGWLDTVILRYAKMINGLDSLAITKLDVLGDLGDLKICTAYEIDGKKTTNFPINPKTLEKVNPVFEKLDGWEICDWNAVAERESLPTEVQLYLQTIEDEIAIPISLVSFGPERESTLTFEKSVYRME